MGTPYSDIKIIVSQAVNIASDLFGIKGGALALVGDVDFNFRIESEDNMYLLKVSRPGANQEYLEFHQEILQHVANGDSDIVSPVPLPDLQGNYISETKDESGNIRKVRLLTWLDGRLWSGVNPVSNKLLFSLGEEAGRLTLVLQGFKHPLAKRNFEWDLARSGWTGTYEHLFSGEKLEILRYFRKQFDGLSAIARDGFGMDPLVFIFRLPEYKRNDL
jgi:Ser/Thr protein kinase RdoA (MazF antagonist)